MLNRRMKFITAALVMSLVIMSFATGCGALKKPKETEPQTQSETESETQTETESETEPQTELLTNVPYASKDGSIRITLPDSTWKLSQDTDSLRVFSSGADAMISIGHAADENAMRNLTVAESEDELKESLTKQYPDTNAFEVVEFEKQSTTTLDTYEYLVKYNATSMWKYAVTYAIIAEDEAYTVTGTVTDDNEALLEAVKKSVESFTVLRNPTFSAIPGKVTNQTGQSETAQSQSSSDAGAQAELNTLTEYGTEATLYAADAVNIRLEPTTESNTNIIGSLSRGDKVIVVGETSQWFKVNVNGNIGYINKAFLVNTQPQSETTAQSDSQVSDSTKVDAELNSYVDYGTGYQYYATTGTNLRDQPGTQSNIIGGLSAGQQVSVIGETDNWFVVSVNGMKAYVSKSYISSTNPGGNTGGSTGGNTGGSTDDNTGGNTGGSTGGNTGSGTGTVSGTIISTTPSTITIKGDDGNTHVINYGDASVSTNDGLQEGLYISATIDYSGTAPNGDLYATNVTGY